MKLFLLLTNLVSQKLCLEKRRSNFQFETWEHLHRYLWATWNLNWLFNVYVQDDNQNLLRSSNRQYVWKGCKWKHHIWDCNCKKIESRPNWILMSLADLGETRNPTFKKKRAFKISSWIKFRQKKKWQESQVLKWPKVEVRKRFIFNITWTRVNQN